MKCLQQISMVIILMFCTSACTSIAKSIQLTKIQLLQNNTNQIRGLDNPRVAKVTPDGSKILVVSADDDALAVFDLNENFKLSFSSLFRNNTDMSGFRGATKVVISSDGQQAFLVSFYDSAVVSFKKDALGNFQYQQTISNNVKWYAETGGSVLIPEKLDTLALLGAYDIAITPDNQQLLIAGSASNALSVFNIDSNNKITSEQIFRDSHNANYALKSAVSVVVANNNTDIFVASYEENAITIFKRASSGKLVYSQTLRNSQMESPHSLAISSDNNYLYVACNQSVVVFQKQNNQFIHLQTLSSTDVNLIELAGSAHIALTPNNEYVFVAAEADGAVSIFLRASDGTLHFDSLLKAPELEGVSSVTFSPDGKNVFITAGNEGNSLSVYKINQN